MIEQNDDVGICLMSSEESEAVCQALAERLGDAVRIERGPTFVRVEARDRLEVGFDQVSEVLGREFSLSDFQMILSTYYGRIRIDDDQVGVYTDT